MFGLNRKSINELLRNSLIDIGCIPMGNILILPKSEGIHWEFQLEDQYCLINLYHNKELRLNNIYHHNKRLSAKDNCLELIKLIVDSIKQLR